nr:MAG TPA: hypothetical protein [Caudoviricetes sp.]
MKKLKCLDTRGTTFLTYGKIYDCLNESEYYYEILNNVGDKWNYDKYRFKVIEEESSDLEELLDLDTDALLESALSIEPVINNNEKVEKKMTLKEKILAKIDYKAIAKEVFDILEDEIVEEVVCDFDETNLAYDLVDMYRRDFIETAKEVIVENIGQEVDVDEVTDMLKEVAIDRADEM